jgi:hypothetical protein
LAPFASAPLMQLARSDGKEFAVSSIQPDKIMRSTLAEIRAPRHRVRETGF